MRMNIIKSLTLPAMLAMVFGCTKLEEQVLDESSVTGLTEKQIADGTIAPVYANLPNIFIHTGLFALQEILTAAVPTGVTMASTWICIVTR